jgi:hypothetical protein
MSPLVEPNFAALDAIVILPLMKSPDPDNTSMSPPFDALSLATMSWSLHRSLVELQDSSCLLLHATPLSPSLVEVKRFENRRTDVTSNHEYDAWELISCLPPAASPAKANKLRL